MNFNHIRPRPWLPSFVWQRSKSATRSHSQFLILKELRFESIIGIDTLGLDGEDLLHTFMR